MELNYETGEIDILYIFQNYLTCPPTFCVFNKRQKEVIVATNSDVLLIDIVKDKEHDIDNSY